MLGEVLLLLPAPAPLVQSRCQHVLGVVVGSASSAAKIRGAFSTLHKLNPNGVGAGVKEGPTSAVRSENWDCAL